MVDALDKPSHAQLRLRELAMRSNRVDLGERWLATVTVEAMDDGGMGSFRIHSGLTSPGDGRFARCIAEVEFDDADGVRVLASLYESTVGSPFEVDVWKTNFEPLVRIPDSFPELPCGHPGPLSIWDFGRISRAPPLSAARITL